MTHDQALVVGLLLGGWKRKAAMAQNLGSGLLVGRRRILVDLLAGVGDRLANLKRHHARDRLSVLDERLVDAPKDFDPIDERCPGPAGLRGPCGGDRSRDIAGVAAGDGIDYFSGVR